VLAEAAERLFRSDADRALYDLARAVEAEAVRLLAERYPQQRYKTNVEFYTALLLHGLDLPTELFSPTFAISRTAGWIAHCLEQQAANRIIRPQSEYVGPRGLRWNGLPRGGGGVG
jgi:citrate synthase